jgi:hypothetical protein
MEQDDRKRSFLLRELDPKQREPFESFAKIYQTTVPSSITTQLIGVSKVADNHCFVWRVVASKGAKWLTSAEVI